jgi:hypothetical protein
MTKRINEQKKVVVVAGRTNRSRIVQILSKSNVSGLVVSSVEDV